MKVTVEKSVKKYLLNSLYGEMGRSKGERMEGKKLYLVQLREDSTAKIEGSLGGDRYLVECYGIERKEGNVDFVRACHTDRVPEGEVVDFREVDVDEALRLLAGAMEAGG